MPRESRAMVLHALRDTQVAGLLCAIQAPATAWAWCQENIRARGYVPTSIESAREDALNTVRGWWNVHRAEEYPRVLQ